MISLADLFCRRLSPIDLLKAHRALLLGLWTLDVGRLRPSGSDRWMSLNTQLSTLNYAVGAGAGATAGAGAVGVPASFTGSRFTFSALFHAASSDGLFAYATFRIASSLRARRIPRLIASPMPAVPPTCSAWP